MPLAAANKGVEFEIKRILGNEPVKHHLENLGFVIGTDISIVNEINGNVIVRIKDSRIAISKSMAMKIIV